MEGLALAAHIAIAVLAAQKVEQSETALNPRTIIALACGVGFKPFNIGATRAL